MSNVDDVLKRLMNKPVADWQKFHEKTKIKKIKNQILPKDWPKEWSTVYFKSYPRFGEIVLPKPNLGSKVSLKNILLERESKRQFSDKPLELSKLSTLLYYSAGIRDKKSPFLSRFYPSAGARYPLEVYLISLRIESLRRGIYHYYLNDNSLEELLSLNTFDHKKYFSLDQKWIPKAPCIILITAIFKRNTNKYGTRGYRHILAEAGSLAQNFYLLSSALNISCCAFDGYFDDKINDLLDIDGVGESVIYTIALGNK